VEVYIGTSGWAYGWNEGGNLGWFIGNAGLNAVELNASYITADWNNICYEWVKYQGKYARKRLIF